mmetsp:Transcript_37892/g.86728  ORF Transcript_37892/g.86728 Transcript_37892/m.86728 type:complete len:81 (-) Transcript_37892:2129-2371(-)
MGHIRMDQVQMDQVGMGQVVKWMWVVQVLKGQVQIPHAPVPARDPRDPWDPGFLLGLQRRLHDRSEAEKVGVKVGAMVHT